MDGLVIDNQIPHDQWGGRQCKAQKKEPEPSSGERSHTGAQNSRRREDGQQQESCSLCQIGTACRRPRPQPIGLLFEPFDDPVQTEQHEEDEERLADDLRDHVQKRDVKRQQQDRDIRDEIPVEISCDREETHHNSKPDDEREHFPGGE